ncbi:hypothetical protein DPMN_060551 [Dreissena polymorpha]|uniref:Uncharacterized protein n=1 Tax=Dreissena polymorpha TaxID=45954 RepID=A0A9D4HG12_DREPO|nr:hypothetical protein DPMN_060551 [Dreissena polymorpha]
MRELVGVETISIVLRMKDAVVVDDSVTVLGEQVYVRQSWLYIRWLKVAKPFQLWC